MSAFVSKYPLAIDENMVGEYPALVKSGAGYFYDDVLEYRVWCHPERGALDEYEGKIIIVHFPVMKMLNSFPNKQLERNILWF